MTTTTLLAAPHFVSLTGEPLPAGNPVAADGHIKKVTTPAIQLIRSEAALVKGTVMLLPGGGYGCLAIGHEGVNTARFLNEQGFDVAILEYHVSAGGKTRALALDDAMTAFRLIKTRHAELGLHDGRLGIMGYSAGGHLAARTVEALGVHEQPDDLILIYPAYLEETIKRTDIPVVKPPETPTPRLFALIATDDNRGWVRGCREYVKAWKGHGGPADFHLLPDGGHGFGMKESRMGAAQHWPDLLKAFLSAS